MNWAGLLTLPALLAGSTQEAPTKPRVQARLLAEVQSVQPGQPFWVGLLLVMDPGWHTYWINPGDSGLPTRMAWKTPEGLRVEPFEWPAPERFATGPLASYGYQGEVLLLARVTPPARLPAGQSLDLGGRASWLECREICIPGRAELNLTLPVLATSPKVSADAGRFARARERLPRDARGWRVTAALGKQQLTLTLRPPSGFGPIQGGASFFAEQTGLVEHGQPQRVVPAPPLTRLEIPLSANPGRPPERLRGVLIIPTRDKQLALRVEVPLAGAFPSSTKGDGP